MPVDGIFSSEFTQLYCCAQHPGRSTSRLFVAVKFSCAHMAGFTSFGFLGENEPKKMLSLRGVMGTFPDVPECGTFR